MGIREKLILHILIFGKEYCEKWYNKYLPSHFVKNEINDTLDLITEDTSIDLKDLLLYIKEYYLLLIDNIQHKGNQDLSDAFKVQFIYDLIQCIDNFKF